MTKLEKIKILDENFIEHRIDSTGELMTLCKMSTHTGEDCSEWIGANEMIEAIQEQERYFKPKTMTNPQTPDTGSIPLEGKPEKL